MEASETYFTDDEINEVVFDVVTYLHDCGVNAERIAIALTSHATRLSFASCEKPEVIFHTILSSIVRSIPTAKLRFDQSIMERITHWDPSGFSH